MRAPSPRRARPREQERNQHERRGRGGRDQREPAPTARACLVESFRSRRHSQLPFVLCRSRRERVVGHALSLVGVLSRTRRNHGMEATRHKVATRTRPGTGSPRVPWIAGAYGNVQRLQVPRARISSNLNARLHNCCRSHAPHGYANGSVPDHVMHGRAHRARRAPRARAFDSDDRFICNDRARCA